MLVELNVEFVGLTWSSVRKFGVGIGGINGVVQITVNHLLGYLERNEPLETSGSHFDFKTSLRPGTLSIRVPRGTWS
jgi:hypothetical protein